MIEVITSNLSGYRVNESVCVFVYLCGAYVYVWGVKIFSEFYHI